MQTPRRRLDVQADPSPELSVASVALIMPAEIPDTKDVRSLLGKVGFKFIKGKVALAGVDPSDDKYVLDRDYFENYSRLRRYLCAYGIESKGFELTEAEKECLSLWVRTAIVPGLWGLKAEVPQELRAFLRSNQVHSMLTRLGFKYNNEGFYFLPGEKQKVVDGLLVNGRRLFRDDMRDDDGLMVYLARFGLPQTCTFKNLEKEERLRGRAAP